jgi:hypothetical protein
VGCAAETADEQVRALAERLGSRDARYLRTVNAPISKSPALPAAARGASNWSDNTAIRNMFLNIFFVHHTSTAAAKHGSDCRQSRRTKVNSFSVEWTLEQGVG